MNRCQDCSKWVHHVRKSKTWECVKCKKACVVHIHCKKNYSWILYLCGEHFRKRNGLCSTCKVDHVVLILVLFAFLFPLTIILLALIEFHFHFVCSVICIHASRRIGYSKQSLVILMCCLSWKMLFHTATWMGFWSLVFHRYTTHDDPAGKFLIFDGYNEDTYQKFYERFFNLFPTWIESFPVPAHQDCYICLDETSSKDLIVPCLCKNMPCHRKCFEMMNWTHCKRCNHVYQKMWFLEYTSEMFLTFAIVLQQSELMRLALFFQMWSMFPLENSLMNQKKRCIYVFICIFFAFDELIALLFQSVYWISIAVLYSTLDRFTSFQQMFQGLFMVSCNLKK